MLASGSIGSWGAVLLWFSTSTYLIGCLNVALLACILVPCLSRINEPSQGSKGLGMKVRKQLHKAKLHRSVYLMAWLMLVVASSVVAWRRVHGGAVADGCVLKYGFASLDDERLRCFGGATSSFCRNMFGGLYTNMARTSRAISRCLEF